ncbi:MAG: class I mannose-6-phosphate isomerase [Verrucomicrobiales bacterium]|nr:class I mannose-6-phosphate isomerase [Verrucomicrobiales bacterium]
MWYPLTFHPIFKPRPWGGRALERLYNKPLPPDLPVGESWEIADRPGDVSVIANGPLAGRDLHWLVENHRAELLGDAPLQNGRFPLLVKILDAREVLSVQVHPPAHRAAALGGEPKTELWYVAHAEPGATLFAGLKRGVARAEFEQRLRTGTVADCIHRIPVQAGDALFLPSGRVHALGGGVVVFEIQQNSDTTYRVFDWNRVGLNGKPRELHVAEALASIQFDDFEPALLPARYEGDPRLQRRLLVEHALFSVELLRLAAGTSLPLATGRMRILGCVRGRAHVRAPEGEVMLNPGDFSLLPAALRAVEVAAATDAELLHARPGAA